MDKDKKTVSKLFNSIILISFLSILFLYYFLEDKYQHILLLIAFINITIISISLFAKYTISKMITKYQEKSVDNEKNKLKIIEQSKYAVLGEMIGNIAHQWRQPLSAISTISSGTIIQNELGIGDLDSNKDSFEKILKHVKFLSQTIDDFRNYMRTCDDKKDNFDINSSIASILNIIELAYKDNKITLIKELSKEPLIAYGVQSELSQVLLNIFNNSKDILIEKQTTQKIVKIETYKKDSKNIIKIYDSGDGIPSDIKDKVFDPYFTTKDDDNGTGIGLYMSKNIINNKFNGKLYFQNIDWYYQNKKLSGVCFVIEI